MVKAIGSVQFLSNGAVSELVKEQDAKAGAALFPQGFELKMRALPSVPASIDHSSSDSFSVSSSNSSASSDSDSCGDGSSASGSSSESDSDG